jgi:hypothetical protein
MMANIYLEHLCLLFSNNHQNVQGWGRLYGYEIHIRFNQNLFSSSKVDTRTDIETDIIPLRVLFMHIMLTTCNMYMLWLEALSTFFPLPVHRITLSSFTVMVTTQLLQKTQQCITAWKQKYVMMMFFNIPSVSERRHTGSFSINLGLPFRAWYFLPPTLESTEEHTAA